MKYQSPYGSDDPDASYVDRNNATATKGSAVPAKAIEQPQRELVALISAAGLTPGDGDLSQVAKAIQAGKINYAVAGGTANALTATLTPPPTQLTVGMRIFLKTPFINSSATPTLNVNGFGPATIVGNDGSTLPARAYVTDMVAEFEWDGANWRLLDYTSLQTPPRNVTSYSVAGSYTFIVPAGVYKLYCTCVGAGGGAGGIGQRSDGSPKAAGGGGAGGSAFGWIDVDPGQSIAITVGAGGPGGAASANAPSSDGGSGSTGGTSSIGAYMSATGGSGGSGVDCSGGAGGTGVGGQINQIGGAGTDGSGATNLNSYGGAGGASSQGGGGRPSTTKNTIQDGQAKGSGAGSCYYNGWTSTKSGGNGASGLVILQY
ncbi:hypothetical protein [Rhizobium tropici]|uniref:Glycine-rich domain-containing protein n=1 Tax=Rhizobium tropici TaxID=398 RepID=A0A329YN02_RHITR|nr:hypothetical protein [Rhizobium tropici]RAX42390.1 hypothetical protein DQ393_05990 [Rhizobium tropici]